MTYSINHRRRAVLSSIASAAVLTPFMSRSAFAQAGSPSSPYDTELDKLYRTALDAKESQVIVYGAYSTLFRPIWNLFTKRYPQIAIVGNPIAGAQLAGKLDAEFSSGQHTADIVTSGFTELLAAVAQDRAAPFAPPTLAGIPERYRDSQNRFVVNYAELYGVVYNTNKLKPADLPRSTADLLQPRYKGAIIDDPAGARTTELAWIDLYHSGLIDASWIKAMRAQTTVVPSTAPFFNQLTTGTVSMIPWGGHARYLNLKRAGAPVGFSAVPGLGVPVLAGTLILKNAPHPNAARLFQAWFLTPEAQNAIVALGDSYGLLPSVALPDNPADWPKLAPIADALKPLPPSEFIAARDALRAVVRTQFG